MGAVLSPARPTDHHVGIRLLEPAVEVSLLLGTDLGGPLAPELLHCLCPHRSNCANGEVEHATSLRPAPGRPGIKRCLLWHDRCRGRLSVELFWHDEQVELRCRPLHPLLHCWRCGRPQRLAQERRGDAGLGGLASSADCSRVLGDLLSRNGASDHPNPRPQLGLWFGRQHSSAAVCNSRLSQPSIFVQPYFFLRKGESLTLPRSLSLSRSRFDLASLSTRVKASS